MKETIVIAGFIFVAQCLYVMWLEFRVWKLEHPEKQTEAIGFKETK